jgi:hypothetical protein
LYSYLWVNLRYFITSICSSTKRIYDKDRIAKDNASLQSWGLKGKDFVSKLLYAFAIPGTLGRCILFGLLAAWLLTQAYVATSSITGFAGALGLLQTNHAGRIALGIEGALLIIFGFYSILLSRYKKFLPYKPRHILQPAAV